MSAAVEKFTIKYVSPVLSAQEISCVQSSTQMFDSMTVSISKRIFAPHESVIVRIDLIHITFLL